MSRQVPSAFRSGVRDSNSLLLAAGVGPAWEAVLPRAVVSCDRGQRSLTASSTPGGNRYHGESNHPTIEQVRSVQQCRNGAQQMRRGRRASVGLSPCSGVDGALLSEPG